MEERYAYEERLITEVEAHRIIYDKMNVGHKIRGQVDKAWTEIATLMGKDESIIKKKWKNLKDTYRAKLKEYTLASVSDDAKKKKDWIFYKRMSFLAPFMDISGTESNYSAGSKNAANSSDTTTHSSSDSEKTAATAAEADTEVSSDSDFAIPSTRKRKLEQLPRDLGGIKISKAQNNVDEQPPISRPSAIREFLSSMATKAEALSEYDQYMFEASVLQVYASIKFPENTNEIVIDAEPENKTD